MRRPSFALIGILASLSFVAVGCQRSGMQSSDPASMPLLSRRIFAPDPNDTIIDLTQLRSQMKTYAASLQEPFGLYFEYLPSGSAIGINSQTSFIEASLLKLPVVIKAYQLKEEGLLSFDEKLSMTQDDINPSFGSLWQRGVGTELPVREIIRLTLEESDNTALQMLGRKLSSVRPGYVNEVFDNLDIPKELGPEGVMVSAHNYTSILRSLYLSASLSKTDSQEILSMLTETKFSDELPAGVPAGIKVAHKIGVYDKDGVTTYSDCGIIYIPKRPYSLCVLVRGSQDRARAIIQDFSRMAYGFISNAKAVSYNDLN